MRLFFLLLLLANIAFFTWNYQLGEYSRKEPAPQIFTKSDPDIPTLTLVSERDRANAAPESSPTPAVPDRPVESTQAADANTPEDTPAVAVPEVASVRQRCIVAGPYESREAAVSVQDLAGDYGVTAAVDPVERQVTANSWVLLKGRYSLAEARRILQEMRAKGLSDVAITPLEEGTHVISLGLYSRQGTLEDRLREIVEYGYTAEVQERTRTVPGYSVRLSLKSRDLASMKELIDELVEREPRIEWRDVECR